MGQLRGLLRGIAYRAGVGPADVLTQLDLAMRGLQVQTMATAVIGRMEQTPDERVRGAVRLRWSSAGHPPVMVVHGSGRLAVLGAARADLMLGVDPESPRQEEEVVLERGATVLLYTDGLVEGRDLPLDVGLARLRAALESLAHHPLEELCDRLVHRLRPGGSEDDIALVAVRVHGSDRPPGG
jgi:serine phosphatase RsbU (regulator of sigma subunit)